MSEVEARHGLLQRQLHGEARGEGVRGVVVAEGLRSVMAVFGCRLSDNLSGVLSLPQPFAAVRQMGSHDNSRSG
jgi:hypothetical protein